MLINSATAEIVAGTLWANYTLIIFIYTADKNTGDCGQSFIIVLQQHQRLITMFVGPTQKMMQQNTVQDC